MANVLEIFKNEEIIDFSQGLGSLLNKDMMGDRLFPDTKTKNLKATYYQLSDGMQIPTMAQVHAFDSEAKIGVRPTIEKITLEKLEDVLQQLAFDQYFELLSSERKGEKMYVISLRANGYAYKRCTLQQKRNVAVKMLWAITSAVVAFLVGLLLRRIF